MKREELIRSKEFWLIQIQNKVFNLIDDYRKENKVNQTKIAEHLGVTKGYVSQILNGEYDHKVSKLIDLSLSFGKAPVLNFIDIRTYIEEDKEGKNSLSNPHSKTVNCWISFNTSDSVSLIKIDDKFNSGFAAVEKYFEGFRTADVTSKSEAPVSKYINYNELSDAK